MRRTQPLKPAEHAILGLLYQSPSHGYELAEWFGPEGEFGDVCRVHPSLLYAHLKRLESPGYVVANVERQVGRPPRHIYHLTDIGRAEFWRWLEQPARRNREIRLEFLLRLYLSQRMAGHDTLRLIDAQLAVSREQLAAQKLELERYSSESFARLVRQLRLTTTEGTIVWLQQYREQLAGQRVEAGGS